MSLRTRSRKISSRNKSRRSLFCQLLEPRMVLSAVALVESGVVTVNADDEANEIAAFANEETDTLTITVDQTEFQFANSQVRQIRIFGNGGDDSIGIRDSVRQTTVLDGGDGNDTIIGSQQRDAISGGNGADRIAGRGGNDRINGGNGNDAIDGGDGDDAIAGGNGGDLIRGGSGDDKIQGDPVEHGDVDTDELPLADAIPVADAAVDEVTVNAVGVVDQAPEPRPCPQFRNLSSTT